MPAPSSTPTDAAVRARGVGKTLGAVRALDGVSFTLGAGELVALVGANGSGKSTLLKLLFGVLAPDEGRVEVMGRDPRRDHAAVRALAGYAGQDAALDPEMTGWETLRLFHALRGLPRRDRQECLEQMVDGFGLGGVAGRPVATWSGGERQRLHLALEAMHGQRLLLLDEPTAGLDPEGRRDLWSRLADWCREGNTALVATHDLADAAARCGRVLLLQAGRLIADDSPSALVAAHARARATVTLARPVADEEALARALGALPGVSEVGVEGRTVTIWRDRHPEGGEPVLDLLAAHGVAYRGFEREEPDLAGAWFRLTGSPLTAREPRRGGRRGGRRRG